MRVMEVQPSAQQHWTDGDGGGAMAEIVIPLQWDLEECPVA